MRSLPFSLWLQVCFAQVTVTIIRPASAYRALELGVDLVWLGILAASFSLLPLLLVAVVGRFADGGHERAAVTLGSALMLVAALGILIWSSSLVALLLWNAIAGVGHIVAGVGQQTMVARTDARTVDASFGVYTFAGSAGQMIGPLMITLVGGAATFPDTTLLFAGATASAVLTLVLAVVAVRGVQLTADRGQLPGRRSLRGVLGASRGRLRALFGAIAVSMVILAVIDLLTVYLPAWGVQTGNSAFAVGILLAARAFATMLSRLAIGALVRRFSRPALIVASSLVAAVAIMLLAFSVNVVAAGAVLLVAGAALGIGQPLTMAVISVTAPPGTVGMWLSIRLSGNSLGLVVIPPAIGLIAGVAGTTGVFVMLAIALLGVSGASLAGAMRDAPREE